MFKDKLHLQWTVAPFFQKKEGQGWGAQKVIAKKEMNFLK